MVGRQVTMKLKPHAVTELSQTSTSEVISILDYPQELSALPRVIEGTPTVKTFNLAGSSIGVSLASCHDANGLSTRSRRLLRTIKVSSR